MLSLPIGISLLSTHRVKVADYKAIDSPSNAIAQAKFEASKQSLLDVPCGDRDAAPAYQEGNATQGRNGTQPLDPR
jgi:hypothetical protein